MLSRRSILGRLAAALAAAPIAAALPAATPTPTHAAPALAGPITPDDYIAEMHAIGWQPFAGCYTDFNLNEVHAGVIELYDGLDRVMTAEEVHRRFSLQRAVASSGPDFYDRVSDRLYELGYRRDVM
jgi:hypothetical protein